MSHPVRYMSDKPHVIFCEGADERYFLIEYLKHLKNRELSFQDCCNVIDLGGISEMGKQFANIPNYPQYDDMESFLFVRDAEQDASAAVASLKNGIKKIWDIEIPDNGTPQMTEDGVKVGFFLFPGFDTLTGSFRNGTLEDMCLDMLRIDDKISTQQLRSLVQDYINRLEVARGCAMKWQHKNTLHLCLDSTDKYVGAKIGEAAKYNAFDLEHASIQQLHDVILAMQKTTEQP